MEEYEMCFSIFIKHDEIMFFGGDLEYLSAKPSDIKRRKGAFIFREETGEIIEQGYAAFKKRDVIPAGCSYVADIIALLTHLNDQGLDKFEMLKDTRFVAVSTFLGSFLKDRCSDYHISLDKLILVFVVPSQWITGLSAKLDIMDALITPLFEKIGIYSSNKRSTRVIYMTEVEALFGYFQISREYNKTRLSSLYDRGRCLIQNINFSENSVTIETEVARLLSDYASSIYGRYLQATSLYARSYTFTMTPDFDKTLNRLNHLLVMKISSLNDLPSSTLDSMTKQVLGNICRYMDGDNNYYYNDFFNHYLGTSQMMYAKSKKFFDSILYEIALLYKENLIRIATIISKRWIDDPFSHKRMLITGSVKPEIHSYSHLHKIFMYHLRSIFYAQLERSDGRYITEDRFVFYPFVSHELFRLIRDSAIFHVYSRPTIEESNVYRNICNGAYFNVIRKTAIENILAPPVILAKIEELNKLGLPVYSQLGLQDFNEQATIDGPKCIINIDISLNSTTMVGDTLDKDGYIDHKFNVNVEDTRESNFQSLKQHFKANFIDYDITKGFFLAESYKKSPHYRMFSRKFGGRKKVVDMYSTAMYIKSCYTIYLKKLISRANAKLESRNIQLHNVGYVLCIDKIIMNQLQIKSGAEMYDLIKESGAIAFDSSFLKLVVKENTDKIAWNMFRQSNLKALSYCLCAHISDDYIYLKVYRILDATNDGKNYPATALVNDQFIATKNIYHEASENLWFYLQDLSYEDRKSLLVTTHLDDDNSACHFQLFVSKLTEYLKEQLFNEEEVLELHGLNYNHKNTIELTEYCHLYISTIELISIAILPILKKLARIIVINNNTFELYHISKLFITGRFLQTQKKNDVYNHLITRGLKSESRRLLSNYVQIDVSVITSLESQLLNIIDISQKHYCYDQFLNGELRIVSSSTYFIKVNSTKDEGNTQISMESRIKHDGSSYSLILQGEELAEKNAKVICSSNATNNYERQNSLDLGLYKYNDSSNSNRIQMNSYFNLPIPLTIRIEPLNYCFSIKISYDYFYHDNNGLVLFDSDIFVVGERQTFKYFK